MMMLLYNKHNGFFMSILAEMPKYQECEDLEDEIWKQIPLKGFERLMASNLGRIKRFTKRVYRKPWEGYVLCEPWIYNNYLALKVTTEPGNSRHYFVHRLIAITFLEIPNGLERHAGLNFLDAVPYIINHKDSNKINNHVDNLEWCDNAHNITHAYENNVFSSNVFVTVIDTLTGVRNKFISLSDLSVFSQNKRKRCARYSILL